MKSGKFLWIQFALGMICLTAGAILSGAITAKTIALNGHYAMHKVLVSLKDKTNPQSPSGLTLHEMNQVQQLLNNSASTFSAGSSALTNVTYRVGANILTYPVQIHGLDCQYPQFNDTGMLFGGFWNKEADDNALKVAVIDADLAWNIFKTTRVIGRTLLISDIQVTIIGILAAPRTIFHYFTDSGGVNLYLPVSTLMEMDNQTRISSFQWQTVDNTTIDQNKNVTSNLLQQIGKMPAAYNITDYNIKQVLLEQKSKLLIFLLGLLLIFMILGFLRRDIHNTYISIKESYRNDYLGRTLYKQKASIGKTVLKITLGLGLIILIWSACSFKIYIPPRYIPEELIDVSYYNSLIKNDIRAHVATLGYIPDHTELVWQVSDNLTNWLLFGGLLGGLFFIYNSFYRLEVNETALLKIIVRCGLVLVGSVLLVEIIAICIGVPPRLDLKAILVIWSFIFVKVLTTQKTQNRIRTVSQNA